MTEFATPTADSGVMDDLRAALAPFLHAACVGWMVEQDCREAKPNQHTDHPLIAFASYCGQYAAQSRVSWADWRNLLDVADRVGLLRPAEPQAVPDVSKPADAFPEPPLPDDQLANGGACS